jgi:hypothetical protein
MIDVNPNYEGLFSQFLSTIITIVTSIGEYCGKFWAILNSYTVESVLEAIVPDGFFGDIIDIITDLLVSDYFLDMLLWEFLLFGGLVFSVFLAIYKAVH